MRISGQTDQGRVRTENQDSFGKYIFGEYTLCVVCDGMGGAAGGKTASSMACSEFMKSVAEKLEKIDSKDECERVLQEGVMAANGAVYSKAQSDKELSGMGTTLCAILTDEKKVWAVSVGDSRIYMFKELKAHQISHDHSYVQALVDSGTITKEESRSHPNKNIITRAIGTAPEIYCDSFVMEFDADGFLLCSDGLSNYFTEDELYCFFSQYSKDENALAGALIQQANLAGGADNITALVIINDK